MDFSTSFSFKNVTTNNYLMLHNTAVLFNIDAYCYTYTPYIQNKTFDIFTL